MEHPFKRIFSKHWNWKFLYYYLKICSGPDITSNRAAFGPRAVVCPSLFYTMIKRPERDPNIFHLEEGSQIQIAGQKNGFEI